MTSPIRATLRVHRRARRRHTDREISPLSLIASLGLHALATVAFVAMLATSPDSAPMAIFPAESWLENYNFTGSRWDPLNEDLSQEYAFALAMSSGSEVPEEWDRMLPTETELSLMGYGITSKLLSEWF